MPNAKQKKVADALIENMMSKEPLTKGQLLVEAVSYTPKTAKVKGNDIITHPGVKQAMQDRGFTVENAKAVVSEIMFSSETDVARLKATDQVFKVLGAYAPEKQVTMNLDVPVAKDTKVDEYVKDFEEGLKAKLLSE